MGARRLSEQEKREIRRLYRAGTEIADISKATKRSKAAINKVVKTAGLARKRAHQLELPMEDQSNLVIFYDSRSKDCSAYKVDSQMVKILAQLAASNAL